MNNLKKIMIATLIVLSGNSFAQSSNTRSSKAEQAAYDKVKVLFSENLQHVDLIIDKPTMECATFMMDFARKLVDICGGTPHMRILSARKGQKTGYTYFYVDSSWPSSDCREVIIMNDSCYYNVASIIVQDSREDI